MEREIPNNHHQTTPHQKWRPKPLGSPYPTDPFVEAGRPKASQYDDIMHSPAKLVLSNKMNKDNKFEYLELDEDMPKPNVGQRLDEEEAAETTEEPKTINQETTYFDNVKMTIEEQLDMMEINPQLVGLSICIIGVLGFLSCVIKVPDYKLY